MNILLKSAKIMDSNSKFYLQKKDVLIEKGIITKITSKIPERKNTKIIQLDNLHISNGWFDTSVCFGEPGFEERETIKNGLKTAAKSGFTAIAINPNTEPLIDNKSAVAFLIGKSEDSLTSLYPIANLTKQGKGEEIAELFDMQKSGAIAFGDYKIATSNVNVMKIALQYAQNFEALIMSFPQEKTIANGYVNEGKNSTKLGLKGIPALAEELQIARDLLLLAYTGGKLHIPCISTSNSVKLIADAKKKGLNVTCSVAVHNLVLTDDELFDFNTNYKVSPPLRAKKDCNALRKGLKNGTIDMLTSDHNPIDVENKKVTFERAMFGSIGLESLFGFANSVLDLETILISLTTNPRKRFGLPIPTIEVGETADLTLFNPENKFVFTKKQILSTSKNAIALNHKLQGLVYGVVVKNKIMI
ncbi:MAG: dihydroorotase [Flavobacteriaceae bacterium]|nr:dihydroorotase [Flavobacteriaceae bacterium]